MHSIFTEQPSVRRVFLDNVPHKMSEKEFWQRYLRSKTRSQQPAAASARPAKSAAGTSAAGASGDADADAEFFRPAPLPRVTRPLHPDVNLAEEERADAAHRGGYGLSEMDGAAADANP